MDKNKIRKIRKTYILFSISLGIVSPTLCYFLLPNFNIITEPLSRFGVSSETSIIWFISLSLISVGLWLNGEYRINEMIRRDRYRPPLRIILRLSVLSLFLTALIDMEHHLFHKIIALIFFCGYNLFVFMFGIIRSFSYVKKGIFSVSIGTLMLLTSLLVIPFPSYGVAEISFIILISIWNTKILLKNKL